MTLLRDLGSSDRFPYLGDLGLDPDDLGRLDVAAGVAAEGGFYVDAATGDSRLLVEGDAIPAGVWVAQRALDALRPGNAAPADGPHGFGEGWGEQGPQLGGDRSFPEEDSGGTIRHTPNHEDAEDTSPALM
jgi:hypothetical protein